MAKTNINHASIRAKLRAGIARGLNDVMIVLQRELHKELSKPGTGQLVRVSKGKKRGRNLREQGFHRRSRPGHPPAADTGTLRRSWQSGSANVIDRSKIKDPKVPRIRLGSKIRYARAMEFGYPQRGLKRRPYIQKPLKRTATKAASIIGAQIRKAVSNG